MRKRILILIKGLGRGGAEQLLASAAPHLDTSRFEYEFAYVLPQKDQLAGELRAAGFPVRCLKSPKTSWLKQLRRLAQERDIDLVHSHLPYASIGARITIPRTPSVYTEHNVWECYRGITRRANMLTLGVEDHVFAVSDHVRLSMRIPLGLRTVVRMPPVETLYHGIDPAAVAGWARTDGVRAELGIPASAPLVGTVANLRAEKGLDTMIIAVDSVRREIPEMRLVVVGSGPMESQLRELVHRRHLERNVMFVGYRTDAPRIAAAFDVFALSSIHEGLSIALIEAMALGRPSVVTETGGLSEVIHDGGEGLVVPPGDPDGLAAGILRLLRDPDLRAQFGERAKTRAASFDLRRAVWRMEQVYEDLLS